MKLTAILVAATLALSTTAAIAQQGRFILFCGFAGYCQEAEPRQPGQGCPEGRSAIGNNCVGSDKAPQAIPKKGFCPAGWRESGSYCIR